MACYCRRESSEDFDGELMQQSSGLAVNERNPSGITFATVHPKNCMRLGVRQLPFLPSAAGAFTGICCAMRRRARRDHRPRDSASWGGASADCASGRRQSHALTADGFRGCTARFPIRIDRGRMAITVFHDGGQHQMIFYRKEGTADIWSGYSNEHEMYFRSFRKARIQWDDCGLLAEGSRSESPARNRRQQARQARSIRCWASIGRRGIFNEKGGFVKLLSRRRCVILISHFQISP